MAGVNFAEGLLGYQRQQQALVEDKQRVQENAMTLQVKALGLQNEKVEAAAGALYNPNDPQSLDRVAQYLFQAGDFKAGMGVIKEKQDFTMKTMTNALKAQQLQGEQMDQIGGVISSMKSSPEAYSQGLIRLGSMGVNPSQYGLTGDVTQDAPRLDGISNSFIKAKDQAALIERKATEVIAQNRVDEAARHGKEMEQIDRTRAATAESRAAVQASAEARHSETSKAAQAGKTDLLHLRVQSLSNPNKAQTSQTQTIIDNDPDIGTATGMPDKQRQQIAALVAGKTGKAIAKRLTASNPDWEPSDFDDEANRQLQMLKQDKTVTAYKKPDWTTAWRGAATGGLAQPKASGPAATPATSRSAGGAITAPKVVDPNTLAPNSIWTSKSGTKYRVLGKDSKGVQQFEPVQG